MKNKSIILPMALVMIFFLTNPAWAKKKKSEPSDAGVNIVEKVACTGLCRGNESIFIYEGISDRASCEKIGGEMYSHQGWELIKVCKVMNAKRCAGLGGRIEEFHFPFLSKNHKHLGCTEEMTPDDCRAELRKTYYEKETENNFFMNNVGCVTQ